MRMLRRALWIATTPIAFTILFSGPVRGASKSEPAAANAEKKSDEAAETEELDENPIHNFANFGWLGDNKKKAPGEDKLPPPFSLALLNFGVLVFLVGKYGGPGIARMVRERHTTIASQLAESRRLHDDARAKLDEYTRKMNGLQGEIDALVAGIRKEAEAEKARIISEAEQRAERMKRDAEQQINVEIQRVRTTLEQEAVQAAMAVAEKILREKTTDQDQRQLADRFVKSVSAASAPKA
jgi:F-type H+-transporting ATPase subunit b